MLGVFTRLIYKMIILRVFTFLDLMIELIVKGVGLLLIVRFSFLNKREMIVEILILLLVLRILKGMGRIV